MVTKWYKNMGNHSLFNLKSSAKNRYCRAAAETAELCWMALNGDVNFDDYRNGAGLIDEAIADLNTNYTHRTGSSDPLTKNSIFRDFVSGNLVGLYVSQFLLGGNKDFPAGLSETDGL